MPTPNEEATYTLRERGSGKTIGEHWNLERTRAWLDEYQDLIGVEFIDERDGLPACRIPLGVAWCGCGRDLCPSARHTNPPSAAEILALIRSAPETEWSAIVAAFRDRVPARGWLRVRGRLQTLLDAGSVRRIPDVHREVYVLGGAHQTFCPACGGVKTMTLGGNAIPEESWPSHGVATDAGCICPVSAPAERLEGGAS